MKEVFKTIGIALVTIVIAAIIMALTVQFLWNVFLIHSIDGIHKIGFWQALGINILFQLLFKSTSTSKKD